MPTLNSFFGKKKKITPKKPTTPEETQLLNQLSEKSNQQDLTNDVNIEPTIEEIDSSLEDTWERDAQSKVKSTHLVNHSTPQEKEKFLWANKMSKDQLAELLFEVVKQDPLYPGRLAWVRDRVLPSEPKLTPQELASRLDIPLGTALVILFTLRDEEKGL